MVERLIRLTKGIIDSDLTEEERRTVISLAFRLFGAREVDNLLTRELNLIDQAFLGGGIHTGSVKDYVQAYKLYR